MGGKRAGTTGSCRSSAPSTRSTSGAGCSISTPPANSARSRSPAGRGKVQEVRYEGDRRRSAGRSRRTSTCRSPPAGKSRNSNASTVICRRANSSGPRAASRSAGALRPTGTRASSCGGASARSASTTSSPSPASAGSREQRQSRSRAAAKLGSRGRSRPRARRMGQDPAPRLVLPGRGHRRLHPASANNGQGVGNLPRANRYRLRKHQHVPVRSDRLAAAPSSTSTLGREWTSRRAIR